MLKKPCGRESCVFSVEVFGEAEPPVEKCLYPDREWIKTSVDMTIDCDVCSRLAIHCGSLADIRIVRSTTQEICFRLHGNYFCPVDSEELYIALEVARDNGWPANLILRCPGHLCEAFHADGLTLEVAIPEESSFDSFAANARSIHSDILLRSPGHIRLSTIGDIVAKLHAPWIYAHAERGIRLTCETKGINTAVDIHCLDYVELTLDGYDCYELVAPSAGSYIRQDYHLVPAPVAFYGKVISKSQNVALSWQG